MCDALNASKFTTTPVLNSWHLSLSENPTFIYVRSKKKFPIYRHLLNPIAANGTAFYLGDGGTKLEDTDERI